MAEQWIGTHAPQFAKGQHVAFAITLRDTGELIGAIDLHISQAHRHAEISYWVGQAYWGQGYCTEAGHAVVRYGFETLGLHRIFAMHLTRNPASGRVMQKLGMRHECVLRQHTCKWGVPEDTAMYGLLRSEWQG